MSLSAPSHRRTEYYGAFAFGSVIVTCFLQFAVSNRLSAPLWQLIATFLLGGIYAALGVLYSSIVCRYGKQTAPPLYLFMALIAILLVYVSPAKGFFGIIILPMVSLAIFEFSRGWAAVAGIILFTASVGVFWQSFGLRAIPEAIMSYLAAYAFTTVFTITTKQALNAREKGEVLGRELAEANEKLRAQAAQAEELATTRERNRLTREIHDGLGHYLTVVKTQLDAATALLPAQPERAREAVTKAARLAAEALDDVRRSVGALRANEVRLPLADAIRQLAADGEPVPTVSIEGTPQPLPHAVEHALFRATQEGLTNIRKHARATAAMVLLDFRSAGRIRLEISDNGVGLPPGSTRSDGYGLTGLRERIALLGGTVAGANRIEGGFALSVEVPL